MKNLSKILVLAAALLGVATGARAAAGDFAKPSFEAARVQWDVQSPYDRLVLTVSTPEGKVVRQEVGAGRTPAFDLSAAGAIDGAYTWELRLVPRFDADTRKALAEARRTGDDAAIERLRAEGKVPAERVQSGSFVVEAGSVVASDETEKGSTGVKSAKDAMKNTTAADQVIPDDLIVQGSACVGLDCVNNESFGFDTIRLKENNTRIKFDDTSTGTGFPANDWQLTANDSASGGSSKFSIEDITGSKVPFTVTAGASTNSIFVDSTGRVGFRTSTPVLDLHVNTSNTPALRLEQNNSGGFTAQTWDIGANEANFFVRDVTGGSKLSLRIRPGAPTSSIDISADGDVGVGTGSPSAKLHVANSSGGDAHFLVQETSGTTATRTMAELNNNGASRLNFTDTSTSASWGISNINGNVTMVKSGTGVTAFSLQGSGALLIAGALTQNSNRNLKTNIVDVNPETILAKVASLPISTWVYKADEAQATHLGPMAQDFAAAFGLGEDNLHIAPMDMAGVSLAAVQALNKQASEKDAEIARLQQQNAELAQRLANLEALVNSLASQKQ
ncbi:MAG: tail fiber domain-containing protein [Acidobacteriota bacterium]